MSKVCCIGQAGVTSPPKSYLATTLNPPSLQNLHCQCPNMNRYSHPYIQSEHLLATHRMNRVGSLMQNSPFQESITPWRHLDLNSHSPKNRFYCTEEEKTGLQNVFENPQNASNWCHLMPAETYAVQRKISCAIFCFSCDLFRQAIKKHLHHNFVKNVFWIKDWTQEQRICHSPLKFHVFFLGYFHQFKYTK